MCHTAVAPAPEGTMVVVGTTYGNYEDCKRIRRGERGNYLTALSSATTTFM